LNSIMGEMAEFARRIDASEGEGLRQHRNVGEEYVARPNCKWCWGRGYINILRQGKKIKQPCGCLRPKKLVGEYARAN